MPKSRFELGLFPRVYHVENNCICDTIKEKTEYWLSIGNSKDSCDDVC